MVFVGYETGSKAYRVYDPETRRVHVTRDVVFDDGAHKMEKVAKRANHWCERHSQLTSALSR
ncbi:hypothetical protein E2562_015550 [Oryza meyeriana var. granulata]|uniref:Retroviral polymerase SH3-like domain-containing protein n=1 Tax=Oryza meyeriana var. granulata TaxID=110450 RepID=A0A6G1CEX8_9ORYZ|nr:hypothetical protein E2562_015550 [Oryza meyeriana var. granulata]